MRATEFFADELSNPETGYYVLTTKGTDPSGNNDVEFTAYTYETDKYNRLKENSLVIYRRPSSASPNGKFFFYGICKVESIRPVPGEGKKVRAHLTKPWQFDDPIFQGDGSLEAIIWKFRDRPRNKEGKETWLYFFNQYGMNQIEKDDFLAVVSIADARNADKDPDMQALETEVYQRIVLGQKDCPEYRTNTNIKAAVRSVYPRAVKVNNSYACQITDDTNPLDLRAMWLKTDTSVLLDTDNAVCLTYELAKALSLGEISFDDNFKLIVSPKLRNIKFNRWLQLNKYSGHKLKRHLPDLEFVRWHRRNVYQK